MRFLFLLMDKGKSYFRFPRGLYTISQKSIKVKIRKAQKGKVAFKLIKNFKAYLLLENK